MYYSWIWHCLGYCNSLIEFCSSQKDFLPCVVFQSGLMTDGGVLCSLYCHHADLTLPHFPSKEEWKLTPYLYVQRHTPSTLLFYLWPHSSLCNPPPKCLVSQYCSVLRFYELYHCYIQAMRILALGFALEDHIINTKRQLCSRTHGHLCLSGSSVQGWDICKKHLFS